jgi:hypothetical protein
MKGLLYTAPQSTWGKSLEWCNRNAKHSKEVTILAVIEFAIVYYTLCDP